MLEQLTRYIPDRFVLNLLWQTLHRCVERGGLYRDIEQGLPRGSSLSPLLGALFLSELDQAFAQRDVFYVRYMDDILILAPTRWKLRKAAKTLNQILQSLGLEKHPDKTFIGRVEKGFDFWGYHLHPRGLRPAHKTVAQFAARLHRLYEQRHTAPNLGAVLGEYVRRWLKWVTAALRDLLAVSSIVLAPG